MHVIAERRILVDGVDDVLHEVSRMRCHEADAANARYIPDTAKQLREIQTGRGWIVIAVHVLPQKLNRSRASCSQFPRFTKDALRCAAAFRTARKRHYAIRACFVAALDDRDI